jgi:hypothetical protein
MVFDVCKCGRTRGHIVPTQAGDLLNSPPLYRIYRTCCPGKRDVLRSVEGRNRGHGLGRRAGLRWRGGEAALEMGGDVLYLGLPRQHPSHTDHTRPRARPQQQSGGQTAGDALVVGPGLYTMPQGLTSSQRSLHRPGLDSMETYRLCGRRRRRRRKEITAKRIVSGN